MISARRWRGHPGQRGKPDIAVSETTRISGAVAFVAGAIVAVQGRINGELGQVTDDGVLAAVINFSVGLVALAVFVLARPTTRSALRGLPEQLRNRAIPWWAMLGGLAGASFVAAQSITVSALGVALFTVATVAGQTGMSLAVDRWGLGPTGMLPVSALRVLAAFLATVAVAVAASGRPSDSGDGAAAFVVLALLAGAAVAFQAAFNGRRVGRHRSADRGGTCKLLCGAHGACWRVLVIERALRSDVHGALPNFFERPWLYSGGLMGLIFVVERGVVGPGIGGAALLTARDRRQFGWSGGR